jgi:two-component SAPR family response regulator
MKSLLLLFDNLETEIRAELESCLSTLGYQYQIAGKDEVTAMSSKFIQKYSESDAVLVDIDSKDSPLWDFIQQVYEDRGRGNVVIIAILSYSPHIIGPHYEMLSKHLYAIDEYIMKPLSINQLGPTLKRVLEQFWTKTNA